MYSVKMCYSDWLSKKAGWPKAPQDFQTQRSLGRRRVESQGDAVETGEEINEPRSSPQLIEMAN